jgi:small conductance mechanosensitive channel
VGARDVIDIQIQVSQAVNLGVSVLARVVPAALVLGVGYVLARAARRLTVRTLRRPDVARALGPSLVRLFGAAVYYLLLAVVAGTALVALGVPVTVVLAVAFVVVVVLAVVLQQSVSNLVATIIFVLFQTFRRGELVATMGHMGTVQEILLFNTVLLLPDERLVSLPNSKIQESGVTNYTRMGRVRADVSLTVGYGEDVSHARAVITQIAAGDRRVLADPPFEVVVDELGENGVRLLVFPYVAPADYWVVRNHLREQIKARFDAAGIRFALPQRDVHLAAAAPADIAALVGNTDHAGAP